MAKLTNVHVDCLDSDRSGGAVGWEADGAHFHMWVKLPDLSHNGVIFKNPPPDLKSYDRGYFRTRKLNADARQWVPIVDAVFAEVRERGLVAAAFAEEDRKKAEARRQYAEYLALKLKQDAAADLFAALRDLTIAAEAAGWDLDKQNAPILNAAREALAKAAS